MFARTERLLLRPFWPEDGPALAALGREDGSPAPDLLVWLRTDGAPELIGTATLRPDGTRSVALGLWITPHARGTGYGSEAAGALIDMARHALGLHRISARATDGDPAAIHLLARLGFSPSREISSNHAEFFLAA